MLVGFALVVFALVWLTIVGACPARLAPQDSSCSQENQRHPRKQHNIFRKDALSLPQLPRLPSSVRVLAGGLGPSLGLSLVISLAISLVLSLGLSLCSTGKRQTDNRQERA